MASGTINRRQKISGSVSKGGGTADHTRLYNKEVAEQHPIEAITDLREELDAKLDASTAMPLIEDAVRNKAKGLYYDAAKELAKKPYWYLTAEIDPVTKMGTKESIISGPYNLGQGGGGGGGGVTTVSIKAFNWPSAVVVDGVAKVSVIWSSVIGEEKEPTGNGTLYLTVNDRQVEVKTNQPQGVVEFDISKYIVSGNNTIQIRVLDAYGTLGVTVGTVNAVSFSLVSKFDDSVAYTGFIPFTYIPYGSVSKMVHFIIDGREVGTQTVRASGEQQTYNITGLTHGSHSLRVYFTAYVGGTPVTSNELNYDLIYYEDGNYTPIISSAFNSVEQEQYIPFNIPYRVFVLGATAFDVEYLVDNVSVKQLTVDRSLQYWSYRSDNYGDFTFTIRCGVTTKNFNIHIKESSIDIQPVTQNLALALTAENRSNAEKPEDRQKWEYINTSDPAHPISISCTLTNFNWKSNGWVLDDDNPAHAAEANTVLRLSGDARVSIPYMPFEQDSKILGKTIELEIATRVVRDYSTTIISCLDNQNEAFFSAATRFTETVSGEPRELIFDVNLPETKVDRDKLKEKLGHTGIHIFTYTENGWEYNSEIVDLAAIGITLTPKRILEGEQTEYEIIGDIINIDYSLAARGFYVTPQKAVFSSQQSSLSTQYKEDEHVRLTFVIDKRNEDRLILMYINGIASGAIQYPQDDSFIQLSPNIITLGSNDAVLDIYNIRVYDNNLTGKQVVNNWIADTQNAVLKAERYNRNNIYNDDEKIAINQLPNDLPYIIWDIDPLPQFKGDKRLGNAKYVDPTDSTRNFESTDATYNVQGTSSAVYPVKNIRIKYKKNKDYPDSNFTWTNDAGDTIKKFPITVGGIGDNYFTYKVDYASSEGANNVELVKLYNNASKAIGILTPPQKQDEKVRVGIDGFPIVAFHKEGDENVFCTKANFNNDKANEDVYGFAGEWDDEEQKNIWLGDESWEITNNTALEGNFLAPVTPETFDTAFEIRYPDEDGYDKLDKLRPMTEWVYSTNRKNATGEALSEPVTYTYTYVVHGEDGSDTTYTTTKTFDHDTEEYRLTKFKAELKDWFNVDSTIFYYIFTHLFLMIDSRAKNAFPTYFATRTNEIDPETGEYTDGGNRWFWLPYDMDTAIGINNEGHLVFDYNLEDTDHQEGGLNVFNGQDSLMWTNLREAFAGEIGSMYSRLRTGKFITFEGIEAAFEEHQSKWSENIFNEDSRIKYINPLASGTNHLEMLQGSKEQQRKWWLYNRFKYFDSKYTAADAKDNQVYFRSNIVAGEVKPDIIITPYADIYATVSFGNSNQYSVQARAFRNEPTILKNPIPIHIATTDQETHIYSADQIKSLGDLSGFHPSTINIGPAIKLQELKVGDGALGYSNPYLTSLEVGANTLLKSIDARNCNNLIAGPNLSKCTNIENIYFDGTAITGITLPDGGNIKALHLPGTIKNLTVKNHPLLTDLIIPSTQAIQTLCLENIPVSVKTFVRDLSAGIFVRLIGINETFDTEQQLSEFYSILDTLHGLDAEGIGHTDWKAVVSGDIYVPTISYTNYLKYTTDYSEIKIHGDIKCTVTFMNEGTQFGTVQVVSKGSAAIDPATPGNEPQKAPTIDKVFTFAGWDKPFTNVQENLVVNATYSESPRQYTVIFNPNSEYLEIYPLSVTVDYGSYIEEPTIISIPSGARVTGWAPLGGMDWDFEHNTVQGDMTLYAQIIDENAPELAVEYGTYNTFRYYASDNVGILGYAVTRTPEAPAEWIDVPGLPEIEGTITVTAPAGDYYFWVHDTRYQINRQITAYNLSKVIGTGIEQFNIYEGETLVDPDADIIIAGAALNIVAGLDSHYQDLVMTVNGEPKHNFEQFTVESDTEIIANCTPKQYEVVFDTVGMGQPVDPQLIVYNHLVTKPFDQFYMDEETGKGYIIAGWYLGIDPETGEFVDEWNFETDTVSEATLLYAKWQEYIRPTWIDITIPNEATNYTVYFHYTQTSERAVKVSFGDGGSYAEELTSDVIGAVELSHTYSAPGNYRIKVQGNGGIYALGDNNPSGDKQVVNPSSYIKNLDFAWDIGSTNNYAFKGAGITQLNLTSYMSTIAISAFEDCTSLTSIDLPASIITINDSAFKGCTGVTGLLTIPTNIRTLGTQVFSNCTGITTIKFDSTQLTTIPRSAFSGCSALTTVTFPVTIQTIDDWAFSSCSSLTSIDIPATVTTLGNSVFADCAILNQVYLRGTTITMGATVFNECPYLQSAGPIDSEINYNIKFAWTTKIPDNAFSAGFNQSYLRTIELPDTIVEIGADAFNCSKITSIKFPNSLAKIGSNAFTRATELQKIIVPQSVTDIGNGAFQYCWLNEIWLANYWSTTRITEKEHAWFGNNIFDANLKIRQELIDADLVSTRFGTEWNYRTIDGSGNPVYINYTGFTQAELDAVLASN